MIKIVLNIILIFFITSYSIKAQNLVYNGSFEIRDYIYYSWMGGYTSCPFTTDDGTGSSSNILNLAKGWSNIQGKYLNTWYSTFDYYHSCDNYPDSIFHPSYVGKVGVPDNKGFTLYQYPRTGEGYVAGGFYSANNSYYQICPGELIQSKLNITLQKDTVYNIKLYANLANKSRYSINNQGAYLSADAIKIGNLYAGLLDSTIIPQLINQNGYIEDTVGWVEVSGTFKAKGGEQYITLGGMNIRKGYEKLFNPDPQYGATVYAIDDVSLYPVSAPIDSANCGNDTLICLGNSIKLGKSNVKPEYRNEYSFKWYISGNEDSVFSYEEHPVVRPDSTTTFIVKVIDFKFDHTTDSITVKVVDCKEPTNLVVYPNPSDDIFKFRFNSPIPNGLSINIYDMTGRKLKTVSYQHNYESREVQMDLGNYAAGVYVYSVLINNEQKFKGKLIKLN